MPTSYLPYNPQQQMLLRYALQDWPLNATLSTSSLILFIRSTWHVD